MKLFVSASPSLCADKANACFILNHNKELPVRLIRFINLGLINLINRTSSSSSSLKNNAILRFKHLMFQRMDCKGSPNPTTMYVEGCLTKVIDFLREDAVYVGTAAVIIALIMVSIVDSRYLCEYLYYE